jgi:hypothetical protein
MSDRTYWPAHKHARGVEQLQTDSLSSEGKLELLDQLRPNAADDARTAEFRVVPARSAVLDEHGDDVPFSMIMSCRCGGQKCAAPAALR